MFDIGNNDESINELKYKFEEKEEYSDKELLSMEKEMLGIYISGHPLKELKEQIENKTTINTMDILQINEEMQTTGKTTRYKDGQIIKYAGIINNIKKRYTKSNKLMVTATVEDLYGSIEIILFENNYTDVSSCVIEDNIVLIEGKLSVREDEDAKIVVRKIKNFSEAENENKREFKILTINITNMEEKVKNKLRGALRFFNGDRNNMPVQIQDGDTIKKCGAIYLTQEILKQFEEIVGKENIKI